MSKKPKMNENMRRLLDEAGRRMMTKRTELEQAADRANLEALGISDFDLRQLDEGRITGPVAALQDAIAGVRAAAGAIEDKPNRRPWIEQAQADGDLSRTAKNVAAWLDKNGDGEVNLKAIAKEYRASPKAVRDALDELSSWAYVDLRPSVRTGMIRVKIMR